jgi:hypothetical protein
MTPRDYPREIAALLSRQDAAGLAALCIELHGKLAAILDERAGAAARKRRQRKREQGELSLEVPVTRPALVSSAAPAVPSADAPSVPLPGGAVSTALPDAPIHRTPAVPSAAIDAVPGTAMSRDMAPCPVTSRDISPSPPTPPTTPLELPAVATAAREGLPWSVRLTVAANRGLAVAQRVPFDLLPRPLISSAGFTATMVAELQAAGVPLEFAEQQLFELASTWKGAQPPNSLRYWLAPVRDAWARQQERQRPASTPAAGTPAAAPLTLRRVTG